MVVLIAMAAALGASVLAGADSGSRFRAAWATAREADARGRLHAATGTPATLVHDADRLALHATLGGRHLAAWDLPRGVRIELLRTDTEDPLGSVSYAAPGRSEDYRVRISLDEHRRSWLVAGLTGWAMEDGR